MHDLRRFIEDVAAIVRSHNLARPGAYRRRNRQASDGRDAEPNPYGCADAANILYTIGFFPGDSGERDAWIATLQGLQDGRGGMFHEPTHHPIHTTAHCIAALELFDSRPRHPLAELAPYRDPQSAVSFLENLDWRGDPWRESHRGAGLYASLVLNREVAPEWKDRYFAWLFDNADPETGFFRKGCIGPVEAGGARSVFPHLAGTFHYLFNLEYDRQPLRYPGALVDACLDLLENRRFPLCRTVGFAEIDWVYCLTRGLRQSNRRFEDCRKALAAFADAYIPFLLGLDPKTHDGLDDLHALFGAACCLAELQAALPGRLKTDRPLKLVLDRRPFI